jgi:vanillate/3-O-methylgallate O-demethylase
MINHLEAWYPTATHHYLPAMFGPDMAGYRDYLNSELAVGQGYPASALAYLRKTAAPKNITGSFEGEDISDYYRSPIELGWGRNVKFDHDFIGRAALEAEMAQPHRVGVTLEFDSSDVVDVVASLFRPEQPYPSMDLPHNRKSAAHASTIFKDGQFVGLSCHPAYSYYFRKVLSLSFIDAAFSAPGTVVEVLWGDPGGPQKRLRAVVAGAPYKKDRRRASLETK